MSVTELQTRLNRKQAENYFGCLPSTQNVMLTCTAMNSQGVYFRDTSLNDVYKGRSHLPGMLTDAKARFYVSTLQKVLGKVPEQQRFLFDLVPDMSTRNDPRDFTWLGAIMNDFTSSPSKPRVNLGVIEWVAENSVAAIAQFSFRDPGDAVRFKLTYC